MPSCQLRIKKAIDFGRFLASRTRPTLKTTNVLSRERSYRLPRQRRKRAPPVEYFLQEVHTLYKTQRLASACERFAVSVGRVRVPGSGVNDPTAGACLRMYGRLRPRLFHAHPRGHNRPFHSLLPADRRSSRPSSRRQRAILLVESCRRRRRRCSDAKGIAPLHRAADAAAGPAPPPPFSPPPRLCRRPPLGRDPSAVAFAAVAEAPPAGG